MVERIKKACSLLLVCDLFITSLNGFVKTYVDVVINHLSFFHFIIFFKIVFILQFLIFKKYKNLPSFLKLYFLLNLMIFIMVNYDPFSCALVIYPENFLNYYYFPFPPLVFFFYYLYNKY